AEEADLLAQQGDLHGLAPADRALDDGGVPVVAQAELGNERADVAAQLRDRGWALHGGPPHLGQREAELSLRVFFARPGAGASVNRRWTTSAGSARAPAVSEQLPDSPLVGRAWCPGCEPLADPTLQVLDIRYCDQHLPGRSGLDDEAVTSESY